MGWDVEYTDQLGGWWEGLDAKEQASVSASVDLLELFGPSLVKTAGTTSMSRWRITCMTNIWKHCVMRAATMAKKFAELQARMTPESRADAERQFQQHLKEMPLHELRKAQELSQETLAKALHVNQAAISRMERRTDMYISTLRNYIRAMGGELEIIATFPDGQVKIENFAN
jgi:DNA-binding transcriptional regulator YiaG